MTQMSETILNLRSHSLRVSVGAEFFLFSEEFAANSKIVRVRASVAGTGPRERRAETSQDPGSDGGEPGPALIVFNINRE